MNKLLQAEDNLDQDKEHFWSIGCHERNISFIDLVSLGTVNRCVVHPREVFRMAIIGCCTSIYFAHNHPHGGKAEPSDSDVSLIKRLSSAGKLLKIPVKDFIILGSRGDDDYSFNYFSFLEKYPKALKIMNRVEIPTENDEKQTIS